MNHQNAPATRLADSPTAGLEWLARRHWRHRENAAKLPPNSRQPRPRSCPMTTATMLLPPATPQPSARLDRSAQYFSQ